MMVYLSSLITYFTAPTLDDIVQFVPNQENSLT